MNTQDRGCISPNRRRRGVLFGIATAVGGAAIFGRLRTAAGQAGMPPIVQPAEATRAAFMQRAFDMRALAVRAGDQAFGGAVVKDGRVVGQAASAVIVRHDPTAHADIEAIRDAARRLGTRDLAGAELYVTSKPCPMCETAAYWAGIETVYWGENASLLRPKYLSC